MKVVEIKKQKPQKCVIKRKLKFENYKNYLQTTQIENNINHQEKILLIQIVLKNNKEFIKINKLLLKTQQRFKSETRIVFTEEINEIVLSSNADKRLQSIDSIET